jgi:hypothetical protein
MIRLTLRPSARRVALAAALLGVVGLASPFAAPVQAQDDEEEDGDEESEGEGEGGEEEGDKGGDKPAPPPTGKRELDTTSPEAKAIDEMLHVPTNYGKDKRVELTYTFAEVAEAEDFEVRGFDKAEAAQQYQAGFELGVGSRGQGLVLHRLALKGDFEVEYKVRLDWIAPSSQLVFVFADGKAGGIWGPYFAKRGSSGYKPLAKVEIDRGRLASNRECKLRYVVQGEEVTCFVDGVKAASSSKLKKLDGRLGIYMTNMRLVLLSATIKGEVDAAKL